jgi:regulator of PEP synthase PpsR (kinase-PPPase family)
MYLAFKGYKVANIPLVPGSEPPPQLLDVDPGRVFGLVTDPELLIEIRRQRLPELGFAGEYAEPGAVRDEVKESRAVMRKLGCVVVKTGGRAIEETAQEVLRYFECAVPQTGGGQPRTAQTMPTPRRRARRPMRRGGD